MKTAILVTTCLVGSLAFADGSHTQKKTRTTTTTRANSVNEPTRISDMKGASELSYRHVRTAGRSSDPNSGMAAPVEGSVISEMNDYRYSPTFGVREGFPMTTTASSEDEVDFYTADEDFYYDESDETDVTSGAVMERQRTAPVPAVRDRGYDYSTLESDTTSTTGSTMMTGPVTADQQGKSERDLAITRQIRASIMKNDNLSTRAHNLTIVTANGNVRMRGTVPNGSEKQQIEQIARGVEGVSNVDSSQVRISR